MVNRSFADMRRTPVSPALPGFFLSAETMPCRVDMDRQRSAPRSGGGQIARRVDRASVVAQLEMQRDAVVVGVAHFGDLLALRDALAFLREERPIVQIGGQEIGVVLDDQQVAVASQAVA